MEKDTPKKIYNNLLKYNKISYIPIITGPTASGKSSFALNFATKIKNSIIINADSLQLYADIPILSAAPTSYDMKKIPHLNYGILQAKENIDIPKWQQITLKSIDVSLKKGLFPIIVGGNAFYLKVLIEGISDIPTPDKKFTESFRNKLSDKNIDELRSMIKKIDPKFKAMDKHRIIRAITIFYYTGHTMSYYLNMPKKKNHNLSFKTIILDENKDILKQKSISRLKNMLKRNMLNEVKNVYAKKINKNNTIFLAHGLKEFHAYLKKTISKEEAFNLTIKNISRYIKHQRTYFKTQFNTPKIVIENQKYNWQDILHFLLN